MTARQSSYTGEENPVHTGQGFAEAGGSGPDSAQPQQPQQPDNGQKPLAEQELDRVQAKSRSGKALDPLALDDPMGSSVERVVVRAGVLVVLAIVVGILFIQVACKNMQLSSVPSFVSGAEESNITTALKRGVLFGGEIVSFQNKAELLSYDDDAGRIEISYTDADARSLDQILASVQAPAMALAMNAFEDPTVNTLVVDVISRIDPETGQFSARTGDETGTVFTITWARDYADSENYSCTISGYESAITGSSGTSWSAAS